MNKILLMLATMLFCISCSSISMMSYEQKLLDVPYKTNFAIHLSSEHKKLKIGNPIIGYTYIQDGDWYFDKKDSIVVIRNNEMAGIYNVTKF